MNEENSEGHSDGTPIRPGELASRLRKAARVVSLHARNRVGEVVFLTAILALIAVAGFAACLNVWRSGWSADAAGWAQAAGSVIAIAGAAWVARSEARQTRRWRREQGEETAWAVAFALSQAQFDAQIVAAELTNKEKPFGIVDVRSWQQRSANSALALGAMLTRTDYIHPFMIFTLCNAKILVDQMSGNLAALQGALKAGGEQEFDKQLLGDIVGLHLDLKELMEQYDGRIRGLREALDRGRDMLPIKEWYG